MGLSFRKSVKVLPGIRINFSNKGVSSVSVGGKGARVNVGKRGIRSTVGLHGTGLSYSSYSPYKRSKSRKLNYSYVEDYYEEGHRKVGFWLGLGILLVPYVFVWFLLRKGYSKTARIISFLWLIVLFLPSLLR